ncbi:multidrug ABC transporter ATP-binding protein [Rhodoblastus sphagnicola]|uniref:Multidrug ABC transporter ATP-binding protein n=1 Tax=Rhodoblastus sphagnicola TaxID=333368 RepID=A0A2S6MVT8_9HYPH|nr:ABC transporter ATP-binding protein [Rhodoblastus sphagnicola]MBB4198292.1 ABC-2 type transport system ATP-binding protein [Rhodoblastus sphagnicola]PPQ26480.1 multidrug ABC transporter ATP-binding protein [Rhodoblastus sphagnicola]
MSRPADDIVIDARNLSKSFGGRKVVDRLSLKVRRGRIHGFLGPNGSGKTTTIRMLCGLLTPDEGEGYCLGFDIRKDQREIKRRTGYMTQKFSLYADLTIEENLQFIGRVFSLPDPKQAARAAIDRLGLGARANQLAGELSGGWKQRLALGACIMPKPDLLLLDEPTAGVDPKARRDFWDEIHALTDEGMTVLVSTHYMDEAERCHEIAYIAYGHLLARGTADEIVAQAGLSTFTVEGGDLGALAARLKREPAVAMVAPFGARLHVASRDALALAALAQEYAGQGIWTPDAPTLEDVFIDLMTRAQDNYQ